MLKAALGFVKILIQGLPKVFVLKHSTGNPLVMVEKDQGFEVVICDRSPLAGQHQLVDAVTPFSIC